MSMKSKPNRRRTTTSHRDGKIVVRGVQRDRPDLRKLSRAVIAMTQAEAEREAQIQHKQKSAEHRPEDTVDE
ncbi:hypothetical protein ACX80T_05915 [Arthrobacter sp. Sr33]